MAKSDKKCIVNCQFHLAAGAGVEINRMLARLQDEKKQKEAEIQRLQDIQRLDSMVNNDVQSGMLFSCCEG